MVVAIPPKRKSLGWVVNNEGWLTRSGMQLMQGWAAKLEGAMMFGDEKLSECQWGARKRKSRCRRRRPRKKGRGRRATSRNCDGEAVDVRRNTRADSLAQDARRPGTRISKLNRESKQERKKKKNHLRVERKACEGTKSLQRQAGTRWERRKGRGWWFED